MTLNTPPQLSSPLLEPFLSNAVPPEPTLAPAQLGKITGYVTCMGHGYRWSRYRYGLEIPTHQKPLPTGQVGTGWCGFFSSNLHCFQAHQCTPPSSTPPASESLFTMAIDSIIQAPQHAPPSSSLPVGESLFGISHFSKLTNVLLPFPLNLLSSRLLLATFPSFPTCSS